VVQRAKRNAVRTVLCDGETIYHDRRFTRVDQTAILKTLHDQLSHALSKDETSRRVLSAELLPHVRRFYRDYISKEGGGSAPRPR